MASLTDSYLQWSHLPITWLGSGKETAVEVLVSGNLLGVRDPIGVSGAIGGVEICFMAISLDTSVAVKVVSNVVSWIL